MSLAERTLKNPRLLRLFTSLHVLLYRATQGAVGGLLSGAPVLLLTTTGRRSGKPRTTPLLCLPKGRDLVVVASYGGMPKDPLWWENLKAGGPARVEIGHHRWAVAAEQASEELQAEMWPLFCRYYPTYRAYQERTERPIPLVLLRPLD